MKTFDQVLHISRKDVRMTWPYLAAYAGAIAVAIAAAWLGSDLGLGAGWSLLITFVAGLLVALLIQGDSAYRTDAFWRTQPIRPPVMLGAKMTSIILLVVGLGLVGQLAATAAFGANAGLLAKSAYETIVTFCYVLSFSIVVALVTPDVRTFLLSFVLLLIATLVISAATAAVEAVNGPLLELPMWVHLGATLAFLLWASLHMYRNRTRRPVIIGAMSLLLLGLTTPSKPALRGQNAAVVASTNQVRIQRVASANRLNGGVPLHFQLDTVNPEYAYMASGAVRDGVTSKQIGYIYAGSAVNAPRMPRLAGVTWRDSVTAPGKMLVVANGIDTDHPIVVSGEVRVFSPQVLARIPLHKGALFRRNGRRIRVVDVDTYNRSVELKEERLRHRADQADWEEDRFHVRWAIVDPVEHVATVMTPRRGSGGSGIGLVVPGPFYSKRLHQLGVASMSPSVLPPTRESFARSELVIFNWREVDGYPFKRELVAPR